VIRTGRTVLLAAVAAALAVSCSSGGGTGTFAEQRGTAGPSGPAGSTGPTASSQPPAKSGSPATPSTSPIFFDDCTSVIKPQVADQPGGDRDLRFGCGRLRVPLDYTNAAGDSIDLFLLRVRYGQREHPIGSLVVNPGGPGGSGLDAAVGLSLSLPLEVLRRFDVVGFDPRGVGLSHAIECIPNSVKDRGTALDPDARTPAQYAAQVTLAREMGAGCAKKYGSALAHYNTEETARDMDLVRQAVGDKKLSYLGYSYGTRLGSVYASIFPDRVRAMVLDGAVDPVADDVTSAEGQAAGFENAYTQFAADCRRRGSRCLIGPDARQFLAGLVAKARRAPIHSSHPGERRVATAGYVLLAAISALYDQQHWSDLESALAQADNGDAAGVFKLADEYSQRDSHGDYTNILDANVAINCADSASRVSDAAVRAALSAWRVKYPLFGTSLALGLLGCQQWPAPRHPLPKVRAAGAPPILVIGTVHDPATPYASAQVLTRQLATGTLLTWDGEGHTAYPKTGCVTRAVDAYLVSVRAPQKGTSCPSR
jgi:pimeloyl-ACP methyl ester carboxylesterase